MNNEWDFTPPWELIWLILLGRDEFGSVRVKWSRSNAKKKQKKGGRQIATFHIFKGKGRVKKRCCLILFKKISRVIRGFPLRQYSVVDTGNNKQTISSREMKRTSKYREIWRRKKKDNQSINHRMSQKDGFNSEMKSLQKARGIESGKLISLNRLWNIMKGGKKYTGQKWLRLQVRLQSATRL